VDVSGGVVEHPGGHEAVFTRPAGMAQALERIASA